MKGSRTSVCVDGTLSFSHPDQMLPDFSALEMVRDHNDRFLIKNAHDFGIFNLYLTITNPSWGLQLSQRVEGERWEGGALAPPYFPTSNFIRLRKNTLKLVAGMNGETNHGEARQSEDGLATP
jgi:hypothetical protein